MISGWASRAAGALVILALGPGPLAAQEAAPREARPGWLGIWFECDGCQVMERGRLVGWRFPHPLAVLSVAENSPAQKAGLQAADTLVRIDGIDLTSGAGGRRFGEVREGQPITFGVRRGGAERTVTVVPGPRPKDWPPKDHKVMKPATPLARAGADTLWPRLRARLDSLHVRLALRLHDSLWAGDPQERERWVDLIRDSIRFELDWLATQVLTRRPGAAVAAGAPWPWMGDSIAIAVGWNVVAGAQMAVLSEGLRDYFPGADSGGVLVLRVAEGTPAERAGLRAGDIIVGVRGKPVASVEEVRQAFRRYYEPVQCEVVRKGKKVKLTIGRRPSDPGSGPVDPGLRPSGPSWLIP